MDMDGAMQFLTDLLSPYMVERWVSTGVLFLLYALYVLVSGTHHLIAYCVAVYLVHGFILFATPKDENIPDPFDEYDNQDVEVYNPEQSSNNLRPFVRNLSEYKFWFFCTSLIACSFFLSLFRFTNIPVYSRILVIYFLFMIVVTAVKLRNHAVKYNYNPFSSYKSFFRD